MASKHTPEQLTAIRAKESHVLVTAAPGTGKTTVIVDRVKHLVNKRCVDTKKILVLAFGKKAAEELRERLSNDNLDFPSSMISTIHALALRVLKRAQRDTSTPKWKLAPLQARHLLHELCSHAVGFAMPIEKLNALISFSSNSGLSIHLTIAAGFEEWEYEADRIEKLAGSFKKAKELQLIWDFDDLIVAATNLFKTKKNPKIFSRYRHIIVDEFQDVTVVQCQLINSIVTRANARHYVVGDPAQTIYGFAGADPDWMQHFTTDWPKAKEYALNVNHRSSQTILDLAMAIEKPLGLDRKLKASTQKEGIKPELTEYRTLTDEAIGVVDKVERLVKNGIKLSNIVVLARHRHDLDPVVNEATKRGIKMNLPPMKDLLNLEHVQDIMSLVDLAYDTQDQVALLRCLLLVPGLDQQQAQTIIKMCNPSTSLGDLSKQLRKHFPTTFKGLTAILSSLTEAKNKRKKLAERLTSIFAFMKPLLKSRYAIGWETIDHDLMQLAMLAKGRTRMEWNHVLHHLDDFSEAMIDRESNRLNISTIHASKGGEWKVVFIIGLNQGTLPSKFAFSMSALLEERRVFFVAVTRAKSQLYISRSLVGRIASLNVRKSQFLFDTPVMSTLKINPAPRYGES